MPPFRANATKPYNTMIQALHSWNAPPGQDSRQKRGALPVKQFVLEPLTVTCEPWVAPLSLLCGWRASASNTRLHLPCFLRMKHKKKTLRWWSRQEPHTKETWRDEFVARVANSFRAQVVGAPPPLLVAVSMGLSNSVSMCQCVFHFLLNCLSCLCLFIMPCRGALSLSSVLWQVHELSWLAVLLTTWGIKRHQGIQMVATLLVHASHGKYATEG